MSEAFDLVVIGAGPGGYVGAMRAAQLGMKVALIEQSPTLGGTCLNVGCIPSKALLHSSELIHMAKHGAHHGLVVGEVSVDVSKMMGQKDAVVSRLVGGVKTLVSKRGIEIIHGKASFSADKSLEVTLNEGGKRTVNGKRTVIATGSKTVELPFLPFDGNRVVSSDEAIAFDAVPERLVVVGGGAIGLELGSVWSRLGSEVTVVEFLPRIASTFDTDISKLAERIFKKQGLKIVTKTKVTGVVEAGDALELTATSGDDEVRFPADKILVAVGRRANTDGLGLEAIGLETDSKGRVPVKQHFETKIPGIYAIGDVIEGPMLAHKAEEEGVALAEYLANGYGHVNYEVIPNVIYTEPEIASAGIGADQAKEQGLEVKVGTFPLAANGRALATDAVDGLFKVIADAKTDRLLGVQVVARNASELIAAAVTHMEYGGSAEDIARTVHAHPTLSEAFKEAALAVDGRALHSL
ncbi:MAG: dihydrolipoyl dehydrogenase [Puniceicoccaceae bacterium]